MQWWGHSEKHGWVVLDRSIPNNAPGLKADLLFFRCRDATTFVEARKKWDRPLYSFAPNYIRDLPPEAAAQAAAELEGFKAVWPEHQRQLHQELRETEERAEAARIESERQEKEAAKERKKQAAISSK